MYAGDEIYDDEVTSGLLPDDHRDDGQCHPACWDRAVAELEADRSRRAGDGPRLSEYRDVAGMAREVRLPHCTPAFGHTYLCDRDGRWCSSASSHSGPCKPHGSASSQRQEGTAR